MQSVILPNSSIPTTVRIPVSEFPSKSSAPAVSFNNADTHLNQLCKTGRISEAIAALDSISKAGSKVRPNTFARLIQSCIDSNSIQLGRKLHKNIHVLSDVGQFIETKLVGMYAKCGFLEQARKVFDEMHERNLFTWSAMIGAYSRERRWREVVELFFLMMEDGIVPDNFLFPKILQACGNSRNIRTGRFIHSIVVKRGMNYETRVHNSVLAVYAKCGELDSVTKYFENMEGKDRVSWNSVIRGYCLKGEIKEAHRLFELMRKGVEPGLVTWNILISSYNQLGNCDVAMEMMKEMEGFGIIPDIFTWTSMVSGFAQNNRNSEALELFTDMLLEGIEPNGVTLASAISACASLKFVRKGKELHCIGVKVGYADSVLVGNSLVDMYSKCTELAAARKVFDTVIEKDVITFNSMIGGYCQAGYCGKVHDLFMSMHESDVQPNVVTWNLMIAGYIQNNDEDQALNLFHRMENSGVIKRDTATWNALIAGYLQNGHKNKALGIFRKMQSFCVRPNYVTVLSILPACANIVSSKKVKEIHGCVLRRNLDSELPVANSFIDTYAKSGNLTYSKAVFDGMPTKDIISWNTLMAGLVLHGHPGGALDLSDQMREEGLEPNRGTFMSIISAYALAKMVNKGERAFSSMNQDFYILPCLDHCKAMVDLYGRSSMLEEAIEFIENMAIRPDFSVWNTLLTACRNHGNARLALQAGGRLLELEPGNFLIRRLVVKLNSLCGISDNSFQKKEPGIRDGTKEPLGQSWLEVGNTMHMFVTGDHCQPILRSWIRNIAGKVKGPDTHNGLCFEEEEEEDIGGVHSEKISLAFALVGHQTGASRTIRILKSLRMCEGCHRTAKYISKEYGRGVYVSDSRCLHHFKDGHCSCGDYW